MKTGNVSVSLGKRLSLSLSLWETDRDRLRNIESIKHWYLEWGPPEQQFQRVRSVHNV